MKQTINSLKKGGQQFGERWGRFVVKFRWPVLIGTLALAMAFGAGGQMGFNSDYHVFFSEDNPQLLAYDGLTKQIHKRR